jgi:uncharacterized RDD family membrane protein YckC
MLTNSETNLLIIRTPEGISFPLGLAGPISRLLAWSVDMGCIVLLTMILGYVTILFGFFSADMAVAIGTVSYFLATIAYPMVAEWFWRGQTVGKRVLRLRVVDAGGMKLQFSQVAIRNLLRFIDELPLFYVVGGLACLFSRKAQRLGDIAANTIVIRNPKSRQPDFEQITQGKYNSFREYPHLAARLRQRVSPGEAGVALQSLLRRSDLDPMARQELYAEMADHFRAVVDFPQEATDGLTDEQYVRNVVDILFRTGSNF